MLSIRLNDLQFFARHGLYEEEKLIGGEFVVNVLIEYEPQAQVVYRLEDTIDYAAVYQLVKQKMQQPTPLLETLAMQMVNDILEAYPLAENVEVSVRKVKPPIANYIGSTEASYSKKRVIS